MKKLNKQNGITLIALIITIIVMLILVAVTITVAINGGLFNFAGKASKETHNSIHAEQELANGRIKIDGLWYDSIDDYLKGITSEDQPSPNDNVKDEHPGELEVIGTDTYEINSIEDLVALSYSVNNGETTYLGKTIELGKNLDFQNDASYANPETKYVLENTEKLIGYRPAAEGEEGTSIKALLVGDSATGFVPIGRDPGVGFYGTINGNYRAIKNMKETSTVTYGGLIGATRTGVQEELNINKLGIQNANINTQGPTGGIISYTYSAGGENVNTINISNCYVTGMISARRLYRRNSRKK